MTHNEFPWSQIDGIQIHLDSDGRMFTFFDLMSRANLEAQVEGIRSQAQDPINALRGLFALEAIAREIATPKTWEAMDELFLLWVTERVRENMLHASPEAKARYEALTDDE